MKLIAYGKQVAQPQLLAELRDAGVPSSWIETVDGESVARALVVQVVTHGSYDENSEWVEEAPDTVEIVVPDATARALVDEIVAAHAPAVETEVAAPALAEEKLAAALEALPDGPLTKTDLADVIATLRGDA